ncbi:DUF4012 domain-containing protein [Cellulomonas edaphi]|uniref:DUF4012 domain-containing protein n=1 Tax=Cellulomonas edaphi TaxID=3053468 RepID=A0ABT7S4P2_9CELL|nr:DUF4012 domain-containing protein [Cellulomons edaphi]MDM7830582.1 DUF4012 domain-containing protein [Cellulomons edaphi]
MSAQVDGETSAAELDDDSSAPRPRGKAGRRFALGFVLVLVVLVIAAGWVTFRAVQATGALMDARDVVSTMESGVDQRDAAALTAALPQAQEATARARHASSDPVWKLAEHVPWAGDQLHAVSAVSSALDDLTQDALPAVGDIAELVQGSGLRRDDGSIDVEALAAAAPALTDAAAVARSAHARVASIDTSDLVGPLAGPVGDAETRLASVAGLLTAADSAASLLPPMLGGDGPRTYLVLALNSAELRSAGGIVGSILEVKADDGRLALGRQISTAQLKGIAEPVVPLTPAETTLHGDRLGRWIQNAVATPDFPRSAQLITARWERDVHGKVDGVVATDPVAVQEVLRSLGPVKAADGRTLQADSILKLLLRDAYRNAASGAQADALFSSVAGSIFGALTGGAGSTTGLVDAVQTASDQGRFRLWSAHDDEQAALVTTGLGSAFLTGDHPDAAGVFLNDATEGKLDYYLDADVSVQCSADASTATVRVTLSYEPPKDVEKLPEFARGARPRAVPPGSLATGLLFYAPVGAQLDAVRQDGDLVAGATATEAGRRALAATSVLAPGGSTVYEMTVPVRHGQVDVWTTPTVTGSGYVGATCTKG